MKKILEFDYCDLIDLFPFLLALFLTILLCVLGFLCAFDIYDQVEFDNESECFDYYKNNGIVLDSCKEW